MELQLVVRYKQIVAINRTFSLPYNIIMTERSFALSYNVFTLIITYFFNITDDLKVNIHFK
jgi:hypothetical protein